MNYRKHIKSGNWFKKHKWWLIRSWGFCALFPFIPIGRWGKCYFPYNIHHMSYKVPEIYGIGVIALNPISHKLIHGFMRAGDQKKYPNGFQNILHFWCRLHILIKWALIVFCFKHVNIIMIYFDNISM
jgi:hypothetical protein